MTIEPILNNLTEYIHIKEKRLFDSVHFIDEYAQDLLFEIQSSDSDQASESTEDNLERAVDDYIGFWSQDTDLSVSEGEVFRG